jgi:hypothetical protein
MIRWRATSRVPNNEEIASVPDNRETDDPYSSRLSHIEYLP